MPYRLQQSGSGWVVVNSETGKPKSRKPLPRARAVAQLRALYANVPDARTKEAGHTGVMLAFFVPASALPRVTALQEGLPNREPAEDLHLTLAYLGQSSELAPYAALIDEVLTGMYWGDLPLTGTIGGIGRFHHDEGNGTNAVYASFDSPALPAFRQRLIEMLTGRGIPVVQNHGFTPHITLAYVPLDTDISTTPRGELPELTFGAFTLAWGDTRIDYGPGINVARLGDGLVTKAANFGARAGETIVGSLGRAGNGQFTTAGSPAKQPARASDPRRPATPAKQPASARDPQRPAAAPRTARPRTRAMQTNRRRVAADLKKAGTGVGPKSMAAMDAIRTRKYAEKLSPATLATLDILKATGMVRKFEDGSFELTDAGKAFMEAADRGDTKGARAAATGKRPAQKSLSVFKDASGRYRWVTRTTTAYRDRDGEIISTKAIADDVAWSDDHGMYGPLRWWHTGKPNPRYKDWGPEAWGPGLDIGDCDLRAVSGNCLLESGTFRDEAVGAAIAAKADQYGISPGFFHSPLEPDADGVYTSIKTFERSLVPLWRGTPANLYTRLMVQEVQAMDATKRKAWEEAGVPSDLIDRYVQDNEATEKTAAASGVAFKEAEAATPEAPVAETAGDDTPEQVFFGDMTLDEAQAWVDARNQPLLDAIARLTGQTATKEASEQQTQTALKATHDALTQVQANQKAVDTKLDQALKSIVELQGDVPAGVKRASQDAATIASKEQVDGFKGPAADPTDHFTKNFLGGGAG